MLSPKTLAEGSAEYIFLMSGFCANELAVNPIKQQRKKDDFFKFILLVLEIINKILTLKGCNYYS